MNQIVMKKIYYKSDDYDQKIIHDETYRNGWVELEIDGVEADSEHMNYYLGDTYDSKEGVDVWYFPLTDHEIVDGVADQFSFSINEKGTKFTDGENLPTPASINFDVDYKGTPYKTAQAIVDKIEVEALSKNLRQAFEDLMKVAPNLTEEHSGMLKNIQKPNRLTDRAISVITISNQEKQEILEELNIKERMEKALNLMGREMQRIKLGEEIQTEVHDEISKTQREYY